MTVARVLSAEKAASKVVEKIKGSLPKDSMWTLREADGLDEAFVLTIYAAIDEEWPIRETVREMMADMLEHGLPLVLAFESLEGLEDIEADVHVNPVCTSE